MPATDDEIQEKYLERAIRELNQLTRELQECEHCPRGKLMPVLGSGHPQADIFMLKHAPTAAEIEEGVAFYGRAGNALMKSFKRLGIDPLVVYGTLCVKCPIADPALAAEECVARLVEEIAIVAAEDRRRDGRAGPRGAQRRSRSRSRGRSSRARARCRRSPRRSTPSYVPDIDVLARRGGRQAALLARLPDARRLVRRAAAVLSGPRERPQASG